MKICKAAHFQEGTASGNFSKRTEIRLLGALFQSLQQFFHGILGWLQRKSANNEETFLVPQDPLFWDFNFFLLFVNILQASYLSTLEGIKWAPSQFSSCAFTWLFLRYILKCKFNQNRPMPCRNLGEFCPPTTPMSYGKFCTEIKENTDYEQRESTWCLVKLFKYVPKYANKPISS